MTIRTSETFSLAESVHKDRASCWRLISAAAAMQKLERIEVNGQFTLHEMGWSIEIYESQNTEYADDVGLDFAQVVFQNDIPGNPSAVLLAHLRGCSFQRLRHDLLAAPNLRLSFSFPVHGIFHDSDRGVDRWLTSSANRLEVPDLHIHTELSRNGT